jgi:hypothetical protein
MMDLEIDGTAIELPDQPVALTDKQIEATVMMSRTRARHVCLVGGSRSGKTVALLRALVLRAHKRPSRHAVLRYRANTVWSSIGADTLPTVFRLFFPNTEVIVRRSDMCFLLPEHGSEIWLGGLDDKDRAEKILGHEFHTLYFNECSQIPYTSVVTALTRLAQVVRGSQQRAFYDLNPGPKGHWTYQLFGEHRDPINLGPVARPEDYARMFMNPRDNSAYLAQNQGYLESLQNLPGKAKLRFWDGVYQDEAADSLWTIARIEETRIAPSQLPELVKVVIAVDPSGAESDLDTTRDAIGIIVAGLGRDGHCYILNDRTLWGSPAEWGAEAVAQYNYYRAAAIIGEVNYGGAMVEYVIRSIDPGVNFVKASATRGKEVRAQPVASAYAQRKVHHVGYFPELEDEMTLMTDFGYHGQRSPNRLDAMVYAVQHLLLEPSETGWVAFYNAGLDKARGKQEMPRSFKSVPITHTNPLASRLALSHRFAGPTEPEPPSTARFQAPRPYAAFYVAGTDGQACRVTGDADGLIEVEVRFALSLEKAGCRRL